MLDFDRLRKQDPGTFAELVDHHQSVVIGLGQSLGLRGADLDDAAAEAFAAVYRALPRFEGKSEIGTWIYRIAYRVIVKARQKRKRNAASELPADPPAAVGLGPSDLAEQTETTEAIWKAVKTLDERSATVVELYYRRELPVDQIAEVMQCPTGTVKTLLFRAREKLRHLLAPLEV